MKTKKSLQKKWKQWKSKLIIDYKKWLVKKTIKEVNDNPLNRQDALTIELIDSIEAFDRKSSLFSYVIIGLTIILVVLTIVLAWLTFKIVNV